MPFHNPGRLRSTRSLLLTASIATLLFDVDVHAAEWISITEITCTSSISGGLTTLSSHDTQHVDPLHSTLYSASTTYSGPQGDAETYGAGKYSVADGKRTFKAWMQSSDTSDDYYESTVVVDIKGSFASFTDEIGIAASSYPGDVTPMSDGFWKAEFKLGSGVWTDLDNDSFRSMSDVGGQTFHYRFTIDGRNLVATPGSQVPVVPNALGWIQRESLGGAVPGPGAVAAIGGLLVLGRRRRR